MTVTTEWVNEETGEIVKDVRELKDDAIKKPRATSKTSSKIDSRTEPILTLEDNKYILTAGAVDLLNPTDEDKIDIKFQKVGNKMIPVIGTSTAFGTKAGNRLTKSNTVSYRGKTNEELSAFGNIFTLSAHPTAAGLFVLTGDGAKEEVLPEPESEDELSAEILDSDGDVTEISDDDLNFSL